MPTIECSNCSKIVRRYKSQLRKPAKYRFCTRQCQNTHQGRKQARIKSERSLSARRVDDQPIDHRVIKLPTGEIVRVDVGDYDLATSRPWLLHTQGYAFVPGAYLHRLILERMVGRPLLRSDVTDHINHDKLDNRRSNLRLATVALNGANMLTPSHNTSGYKGVKYVPKNCPSRPWEVGIKYQQRNIYIGAFADRDEAAYVYDQVALQLFGNFARTNLDLVA